MKKDKSLLYGVSILLSTLDIVAILFCGAHVLVTLFTSNQTTGFNAVYNPSKTILQGIEIGIVIIGIVLYPILTKWRQKLRDEVEYDEDGVSKKHGKFSQLSAKERKEIDLQKTMDNERILSATTIKSIQKDVYKDPTGELNKMIGLSSVKQEVRKMEARMQYELEREQTRTKKKRVHVASNMHMCFRGNPGTGKTTVARIIASYLYQYHFMEKPYYFEIDGNFFNGLTMGEASKKIALLCKAAKGSCVYIDEAYALCSSRTQEVIATLVKQMEDSADDITFIFAGYKKEMQEFLDSNSGIKSRIKYWFDFEDYNDQELQDIFVTMARTYNVVPDYDLSLEVATKVGQNRNKSNFGNARDIRNELDKIIDNHAYNLAQKKISNEDRYRLTLRDL